MMSAPRSIACAPILSRDLLDEKQMFRSKRSSMAQRSAKRSGLRPGAPARTITEPVPVSSSPVSVLTPGRTPAPRVTTSTAKNYVPKHPAKKGAAHDPRALPPAVAALLAVTQIPPRKPSMSQQQRRNDSRRISADQIISEWQQEDSFDSSYSSSAGLDVLFEDSEDRPEQEQGAGELGQGTLPGRSTSEDSLPSLDTDESSILSGESLTTPSSVQSRKSYSRREKPRSVPTIEECASSHPLIEIQSEDEYAIIDFSRNTLSPVKVVRTKAKSSFTSNLTLSLQNLKTAALSSISSFGFSAVTQEPSQRSPSTPFSDDVLWSHPFLFPRFSQETRPAIDNTPTEAERRYLNPTPLTFEEQEAPYQIALHAPFLAEPIEGAPLIQMQTYGRGRRKSGRRGSLDPRSEAGRALMGASGVRHREVRENSDFLRIVVMEMNMRRSGKLETGRARLWLPPRQVSVTSQSTEKIPRRWIGESAY